MDEDARPRKSRRDRFVAVASRRTRQVLTHIRRLGRCGNRSAYEYGEADVKKIFDAIEMELTLARARFRGKDGKEVPFSIDS